MYGCQNDRYQLLSAFLTPSTTVFMIFRKNYIIKNNSCWRLKLAIAILVILAQGRIHAHKKYLLIMPVSLVHRHVNQGFRMHSVCASFQKITEFKITFRRKEHSRFFLESRNYRVLFEEKPLNQEINHVIDHFWKKAYFSRYRISDTKQIHETIQKSVESYLVPVLRNH